MIEPTGAERIVTLDSRRLYLDYGGTNQPVSLCRRQMPSFIFCQGIRISHVHRYPHIQERFTHVPSSLSCQRTRCPELFSIYTASEPRVRPGT